ncbi:RNA polymerase sigma factor [Tunicatimonas pelagia]|uniref:RNA polymerase sigma factor n=1 Tax=Tunicatimonas pelagia TaxID=931531 RepID=UPI0026664196|nr:sigma-70 family RNA polymerase sigma factor [Tunicatimonas pelagia]WKN44663.1 sigma-70 family RNA polymerase sigma factor [Tunicatimonas pelagia]
MKQQPKNVVQHTEDFVLWQAFKQGDREAYATIYHQHVQPLFQYGCRLCSDRELVKDTIQDVFYYLWEHRSGLSDVRHIQYYLATALRRKIIEQRETFPFSEIDNDTITIPSFESEQIVEQSKFDNQRYLNRGLEQLTERQREAIFLRYYQNVPIQEIAQIMNIQRRAVYQLLKNAIDALANHWPEKMQRLVSIVGVGILFKFFKIIVMFLEEILYF